MFHKTLTLSAGALLAALIGFGTAQAMPVAGALVPVPAIQASAASGVALAGYTPRHHYYHANGGYGRGAYYHGAGGWNGHRYWRPAGSAAIAVGAPFAHARWCVNNYGRRYACRY